MGTAGNTQKQKNASRLQKDPLLWNRKEMRKRNRTQYPQDCYCTYYDHPGEAHSVKDRHERRRHLGRERRIRYFKSVISTTSPETLTEGSNGNDENLSVMTDIEDPSTDETGTLSPLTNADTTTGPDQRCDSVELRDKLTHLASSNHKPRKFYPTVEDAVDEGAGDQDGFTSGQLEGDGEISLGQQRVY